MMAGILVPSHVLPCAINLQVIVRSKESSSTFLHYNLEFYKSVINFINP